MIKHIRANGTPVGIIFRAARLPKHASCRLGVSAQGQQTMYSVDGNNFVEVFARAVDQRLTWIGEAHNTELRAQLLHTLPAFLQHYKLSLAPRVSYDLIIHGSDVSTDN